MPPVRSTILALFILSLAGAAPKIDKVEPPNWWAPHTRSPIQILLTGTGLQGAAVSTTSKGLKVDVRSASPNGHYLFLQLDIAKSVTPGAYRFQLKTSEGAAEFTFRLDRPGRWLLAGTWLRKAEKPGAEWESDFTTLTLQVAVH
jgi:hypothetical protein